MVRWVLVLIAVVACSGGRGRPRKPGEPWLSAIRIEGNRAIDDDDLIDGLALDRIRRDGNPVDDYQRKLDGNRIRGAYVRLGHFDAKVASRVERSGLAQIVVFTVIEGPRVEARVAIDGLPSELAAEHVLARLPLREGEPFDYELYDDGKEVVKAMVEDVGYPFVDVDESVVTVNREAGEAVASYRIVTGPRAVFGPITLTGVESSSLANAIRGRLTFATGDPYSGRALAESQRALYDLGRLSQVTINFDRDTQATVIPIVIAVAVASQLETKIGAGAGYDPLNYEARLRAGLAYIPERFPLWTIGVDARLAVTVDHELENYEPKIRALASIQRSEMFRPYLVGDIGLGFDYFTVEAYTATGPTTRLGARTPIVIPWLSLTVGWIYSQLSFSGLSAALDDATQMELGLGGVQQLGRFEQAITADLRDQALDTRRGVFFGVRFTEGTRFAGGTFRYLEVQPDLRGYYPFGSVVAAGRARAGRFFGDVPVTERFFSGGPQNHRGFAGRDLAPTVSRMIDPTTTVTVPIGGDTFLETGVELRIPIPLYEGLGTTVFLDGGDVTTAPTDIDVLNLHWAAGIGMFYKFGGFKIRLDAGKRLNRRPPGDDGVFDNIAYSLGVGDTF